MKLYARFTNLGDPKIGEPKCLQDISIYDGRLKLLDGCKCKITCIDLPSDLVEQLYNGTIVQESSSVENND